MKLIVISSSNNDLPNELEIVHALFEAGLDYFHLRKPDTSPYLFRRYLKAIDSRWHNRIMLHQQHELAAEFNVRGVHLSRKYRKKQPLKMWWHIRKLQMQNEALKVTRSVHHLSKLNSWVRWARYDYVLLSPVFDSISKPGVKSAFNEQELVQTLARTKQRVVALGGVDETKVERLREWGFYGCALMGAIWEQRDPVAYFKQLRKNLEATVA